jgi:phosphoglycerate dehydrogenase-like enzyme
MVRLGGPRPPLCSPTLTSNPTFLCTRGILGYGAIGRQVARLASALGMEIYAYTRSPRPTPSSRRDRGYTLPGTGDPEGDLPARWFHGSSRAEVGHFLAQDLDLLVVSLPLSDETRHLLDRDQFEIMSRSRKARCKPGTFLANIARGAVVQTNALVAALENGQIRGAALDVTDPEPLPREHALWSAPNVFITPHVSWVSANYWDRTLQILEENLERLSSGRTCINEVKRK